MKKPYSKPMACFENYSLDMPIALNCTNIDDIKDLMNQGLFNDKYNCGQPLTESEMQDCLGDNTLCYYTNVATLFVS